MGIRFISKSFYKKLIKKLTSQGPTNAILKSTFQQIRISGKNIISCLFTINNVITSKPYVLTIHLSDNNWKFSFP